MTKQLYYNKEYYVREISQRWREYREGVGRSDECTIEDVKDAFVAGLITAFGRLASQSMTLAALQVIRTHESEI